MKHTLAQAQRQQPSKMKVREVTIQANSSEEICIKEEKMYQPFQHINLSE